MFKLLILLGSFTSIPVHQVHQTYQNITAINKTVASEEENNIKEQESEIPFGSGGDTLGRAASVEEIAKFNYLVPNWQWFTKLKTDSAIGYTDLNSAFGSSGKGLCEYISMAMLLEYQKLFVSSGFFTDSEWEQWFKNESSSAEIIMPIHKYYRGENSQNGLVRKLHSTINKVDLKKSKHVAEAFSKFLTGKAITNSVKQAKSVNFMHTSHPSDYIKKEHVPVMVSFVFPMAHNITIFGYNSGTDELAFHMGWPSIQEENSMRVVKESSIWDFILPGFWNTIYIPNNATKNAPRKAFKYGDLMYSWDELKAKGKDWNDISYV